MQQQKLTDLKKALHRELVGFSENFIQILPSLYAERTGLT